MNATELVRRRCMGNLRQSGVISVFLAHYCSQSTHPIVAAKLPYRVKVAAGKRYAWCACGHSKKQLDTTCLQGCSFCSESLTERYENKPIGEMNIIILLGPACKRTILTLRPPQISNLTTSKVKLSTLPTTPVIASKKPFKVELVGGKRHSWCTCGHSKRQPFCDGAHKTKAQGLSPLRFVPDQDGTAWLCGCKYTNNPPYCDGTHKLDIISAKLKEQIDT